jgi:hypothetical protein
MVPNQSSTAMIASGQFPSISAKAAPLKPEKNPKPSMNKGHPSREHHPHFTQIEGMAD